MRQAQVDCAPFMGGLTASRSTAPKGFTDTVADALNRTLSILPSTRCGYSSSTGPVPGSQAWRDAPAMAYDATAAGEKSVLDDILAGHGHWSSLRSWWASPSCHRHPPDPG